MDFVKEIRHVAGVYLQTKRNITRPSDKWYRDQIKPIQRATDALLTIIKQPANNMAQSGFQHLMLHRMNRRLRGDRPRKNRSSKYWHSSRRFVTSTSLGGGAALERKRKCTSKKACWRSPRSGKNLLASSFLKTSIRKSVCMGAKSLPPQVRSSVTSS
jgi:hypothetical protein